MNMAKATPEDIELVRKLLAMLDAFDRDEFPTENDTDEPRKIHDQPTASEAFGDLMTLWIERPGALARVVEGMAVLLDPANRLVDQSKSYLDVHPSIAQARAFAASAAEIDRDHKAWAASVGQPLAVVCALTIAGAANQLPEKRFDGVLTNVTYNGVAIGNWRLSIDWIPDGQNVRSECSWQDLVGRAVRNARRRAPGTGPRWAAIAETFGLGSTFATELCRIFDVDLTETMQGPECPHCAKEAAEDQS